MILIVVCPLCHRQREVTVEPPAVVRLDHDCDADDCYSIETIPEGDAGQLSLAA